MKSNKEIFSSLVFNRMLPRDVNECLAMPQDVLLNMLIDGIELWTGSRPSRVTFADLVGITHKTIYSYFASSCARDYRQLSEEMRIAIIWRIISAVSNDHPITRKGAKYILNGEKVSTVSASKTLGYSSYQNLTRVIAKLKIPPGGDISHLQNKNQSRTKPKNYVVDGEMVSMNRASKLLGYRSPTTLFLRLNRENIIEGSDISHLKPRRFNRRKNKKPS